MEEFRDYGIQYPWAGGIYSMQVRASSPEDAMARLQQAANLGHCFTPHGIEFVVPVADRADWLANAIIWWKNLWSRP